uniref:Mucin-5AC-like n=1 Tax=Hirondellea gigas TaxID=1518452 RepID=A0A6A7G3X4_9CRUS
MASFQKLCLRWNNHTANLLDTLNSLLSSQQHSDVTLACQGEIWHLHRLVLSASSSHFAGLLADVAPGQSPLIIVDGPSALDIGALVRFIYHGEVSVDQDQLKDLLKTASALKIKGLAEFPTDGGVSSCHATLQNIPPQPPPSAYGSQLHDRKYKLVDSSEYPSSQLPSTINVTELPHEQSEIEADPLPLNLSCKRNSSGDIIEAETSRQEIDDDFSYENQDISDEASPSTLPKEINTGHPQHLSRPICPKNQIVQDYSRDRSGTTGTYYKYFSPSGNKVHISESKSYYVMSESSKNDQTGVRNIDSYPAAPIQTVNIQPGPSSWKSASQGVIREARPLLLSDVDNNVYQVPSSYSVIAPASIPSQDLQNHVIKEPSPSTIILPQPSIKQLRTMEAVGHSVGLQGVNERHPSVPVSLVGVTLPTSSSMTVLNPVAQTSSIYSIEVNPQIRPPIPIKKYHELVTVSQSQIIKTSEHVVDVRAPPALDTQCKLPTIPCIPKYKFIPVKSEQIHVTDDGQRFIESKNVPECASIKTQPCDIKHELIPLKTSPPLSSNDSFTDDINPVGAPILTSAFLSGKPLATTTIPTSSLLNTPIKRSTSPLQPITSIHTSQVSPHVPLVSPPQQTILPNTFSPSVITPDQKPILKPITGRSHTPSKNIPTDDLPSQSVPCSIRGNEGALHSSSGLYSSNQYPMYFSSTTSTTTTTTTSTSSNTVAVSVSTTSPVSATPATSDSTNNSSQRVSINMRTFKEEWRRQLLVDYDSNTNMSICMLCFTTFKSYDGPRKNTYVKHAKRFHPVLEEYSEEERDMIISNYEKQYKFDVDMQKEVNKTFRCGSGGGSSLCNSGGSSRGSKVARNCLLPASVVGSSSSGGAANASSGSSTGSSSLPGSRPETDGEEELIPSQLGKSRSGTPDSDGSLEVHDPVPVGPSSGGRGCTAGASSGGGDNPVTSGHAVGELSAGEPDGNSAQHSTITSSSFTTAAGFIQSRAGSSGTRSQSHSSSYPVTGSSSSTGTPGKITTSSISPNARQVALAIPSLPSSATYAAVQSSSATLGCLPSSSFTTIPSSSTLVFANIIPSSSTLSSTSSTTYTSLNMSSYPHHPPKQRHIESAPTNTCNNNSNPASFTDKFDGRLRSGMSHGVTSLTVPHQQSGSSTTAALIVGTTVASSPSVSRTAVLRSAAPSVANHASQSISVQNSPTIASVTVTRASTDSADSNTSVTVAAV